MDRHTVVAVALSLTVAAAAVLIGLLAGAGLFDARPAGAAAAPACSEWTDGCVICARTAQGIACSTPGIACSRSQQRCLRP
ncbi:MAG TPA: hypothetical protein VIL09_04475 [Microvirga sp.]|jgi:hypothetical protein